MKNILYAETLIVFDIVTGVFRILSKILLLERDATKTMPINPKRIEDNTGTMFTKNPITFAKSPNLKIIADTIVINAGITKILTQSEV